MIVPIIIILMYLILTLAIGVYSSRHIKSVREYHGTALGIGAIVFASAGEWLGGTATSGVSEYGFTYGISGAWYTIANGLGVLFLALLFAKLFRSLNKGTVPEIVAHFFGKKARKASCVILVIVMLAVGISQVIAAGKLGQALLGLDFGITAVIFAAVFIVLTCFGGMKAISASNRVHLFVMYGGLFVALILCFVKLGGAGSFFAEVRSLDPELLSMTTIGFPTISSWVIASLLGACTAQAGIQPVLAAKDEGTAKKACLCTAAVVAPFGLLTALLGTSARIFSEQGVLLDSAGNVVTDAKLALSALMLNLPSVAGGLILASVLAAILSTASPIILAAGTMLTDDFYAVRHPEASPTDLVKVSRLFTAISGVISLAGAILLVNKTMVLDFVYAAYSLRGAIFVVLLVGIWGKYSDDGKAAVCMILTAVVAVVWTAVKLATGTYPIASWLTDTYACVLTAFISMMICLFISKRQLCKE